MDWLTFLQAVAIPVVSGAYYLLRDKINSLVSECNDLRKSLHDLEVEVAQTYATRAELEKMEQRIIQALDRMESRVMAALEIRREKLNE